MKKILVIDIETTGFKEHGGAIVEIGIVSLDLITGLLETLFDSVCREEILTARHREEPMGWIFRNSDLTVEEVRKAPLLSDLMPEIQEIINSYPLGVTAYNNEFDFWFLEDRGLNIPVKLPCPMKLATPICKLPHRGYERQGYKWPSVEEAWRHFFPKHPYTEKHRGADDARHEAKIVFALYQMGVFKVNEKELP